MNVTVFAVRQVFRRCRTTFRHSLVVEAQVLAPVRRFPSWRQLGRPRLPGLAENRLRAATWRPGELGCRCRAAASGESWKCNRRLSKYGAIALIQDLQACKLYCLNQGTVFALVVLVSPHQEVGMWSVMDHTGRRSFYPPPHRKERCPNLFFPSQMPFPALTDRDHCLQCDGGVLRSVGKTMGEIDHGRCPLLRRRAGR
jgi:hypothetical protein